MGLNDAANFWATGLPQLAVRDVSSEAALVGALADIAARPNATPRTIRITNPIYLQNPIFLSTAHYGLILRGAGLTTGLFMASGVAGPALQTFGSQPIALNVYDMALQGVYLTSDRTEIPEGVTFRDVLFTETAHFDHLQNLVIDGCDAENGTVATFTSCQDMGLFGSRWRATSTITGALGCNLGCNRNLGATTISSSLAVVVTGNLLVGNFDSSASGGAVTFVGNHKNNNTVTLNAGDTNTGNHA